MLWIRRGWTIQRDIANSQSSGTEDLLMHLDHIHPSISRTRTIIGHLSEVLSSLVETLIVPVQLLFGGLRGRTTELAGYACEIGAREVAEDAEARDGDVESAQGVAIVVLWR